MFGGVGRRSRVVKFRDGGCVHVGKFGVRSRSRVPKSGV